MATQKSRTIDEVTKEFGEAYFDARDVTADKSRLQTEFFNLATEILSQRSLSRKTVEVPEGTDAAQLERFYPGWKVITALRPGREEGKWEAVIEEDPALLKFTYINPDDHMVYERTTRQESPMLDDERLQEEDPKLWEEISSLPDPWFSLTVGAIKEAQVWFDQDGTFDSKVDIISRDLAAKFLAGQGVQRILRPMEELTDKQVQAIQDYLVPGPVTVRLTPPRPAKQAELEEAGLA